MPLDAGRLGGEIHSQIVNAFGEPANDAKLTAFCNGVANAIVQEIQNNALVTATGADPQGGTVNSTGTVS